MRGAVVLVGGGNGAACVLGTVVTEVFVPLVTEGTLEFTTGSATKITFSISGL